MLKKLLGILAGMVAGGLTVGIVESVGHMIFPPPAGVNAADPEALATIMDQIPVGAKLAVIAAWAAGSLVAGWVAAKIAAPAGMLPALVAGAVLLAGGLYSLVTIPHPVWMAALGILVPLPMAWAGARLARA